jgi:hypothetical protein
MILGGTYKKIMAKPQIFRSAPGRRNLTSEKGSKFPSLRSLLMRRTIKSHSFWFRNFHDLAARSGKSTRKTKQSNPIAPVIYMSRVRIV